MPNVHLTTRFINTGLVCTESRNRIEYCQRQEAELADEIQRCLAYYVSHEEDLACSLTDQYC